MTEPKFHLVEDGKWPTVADPSQDWVIVTPTEANAAMWLAEGEPVSAFLAIESSVGRKAVEVLEREGLAPVDSAPFADPALGHNADAFWLSACLDAAQRLQGPSEAAREAIATLEAMRAARAAIEGSPDLAGLLTRSVLAGFAAMRMGVDPQAMRQPDPEIARKRRTEYQNRWRGEVEAYLGDLAQSRPDWLLFPANMLWLAFQWEKARRVAEIKASRTTHWPDDETAHKFIRARKKRA